MDLINLILLAATVFTILAISIAVLVLFLNRKAIQHQEEIKRLEKLKRQELLTATFDAQEIEQRRIGSDIHDDIGPLLSTVKLHLTKLRYTKEEEERIKQIKTLGTQLDDVTKRVRDIARNRVPTVLTEYGLVKAIAHLVQQIDHSGQLQASLHSELPDGFRFEQKAELNLYRIVQELCNNALKHANASKLIIRLYEKEQNLYLSVEDNGVGIPAEKLKQVRSGIGLKNIEARATLIDADFEVKSEPGKGTKMCIIAPLNAIIISQSPSEFIPAFLTE